MSLQPRVIGLRCSPVFWRCRLPRRPSSFFARHTGTRLIRNSGVPTPCGVRVCGFPSIDADRSRPFDTAICGRRDSASRPAARRHSASVISRAPRMLPALRRKRHWVIRHEFCCRRHPCPDCHGDAGIGNSGRVRARRDRNHFPIIFQGFDSLHVVAETFWSGLDDFTLVAIPMFVMMGAAIGSSPAGKDLYEALDRWLYRLPGGLVVSNIGACAIFAALTGSSPACCAAIGKMGIPEMRRRGYPDEIATGSICAGGTLEIPSRRRSRPPVHGSRRKRRSVACSSPASCRA